MIEDSYTTIPIFQRHPIMSQDILTNYQKVLGYSHLKLHDQISHRNIKILENEFIHQIYTKKNRDRFNNRLPQLIFLHGFGGTSITAIRMFEHLHQHFQIHALDIFGFGYSSRGNFSESFTYQQVRQYYVEAIEEWRKALNINRFYLVGHSFGGYISACYAIKYPSRVQHLFLVSPAGISQRRFNGEGQEVTCRQKMFFGLAQTIYNWNIRPSRAMTNFLIGNKFVNSILINRLKIPQDQQEDWRVYFYNVNSQQTSSQIGFYKIFQWPLKPKVTIEDMIRKNNLPFFIDFYFGDSDWMPQDGAQRLVKDQFKNLSITIVPNAGHQIVFDNSSFLCQSIKQKIRKN